MKRPVYTYNINRIWYGSYHAINHGRFLTTAFCCTVLSLVRTGLVWSEQWDAPWLESRHGQEFYFFSKRPDRLPVPTTLLISGYRRFILGEKWPLRETHQSLQSSAEVKNEWGYISHAIVCLRGLGSVVGIATGYGPDGPGIESRWRVRFSAPVQTGPGAHPTSCTMGTGSFPGVKSGRGVTLTPDLLVPWSWKGRAIPLLPLWAVRPVQNLSACTRVHFTFYCMPSCKCRDYFT